MDGISQLPRAALTSQAAAKTIPASDLNWLDVAQDPRMPRTSSTAQAAAKKSPASDLNWLHLAQDPRTPSEDTSHFFDHVTLLRTARQLVANTLPSDLSPDVATKKMLSTLSQPVRSHSLVYAGRSAENLAIALREKRIPAGLANEVAEELTKLATPTSPILPDPLQKKVAMRLAMALYWYQESILPQTYIAMAKTIYQHTTGSWEKVREHQFTIASPMHVFDWREQSDEYFNALPNMALEEAEKIDDRQLLESKSARDGYGAIIMNLSFKHLNKVPEETQLRAMQVLNKALETLAPKSLEYAHAVNNFIGAVQTLPKTDVSLERIEALEKEVVALAPQMPAWAKYSGASEDEVKYFYNNIVHDISENRQKLMRGKFADALQRSQSSV